MSSYENSSLTEIETVLDGLTEATSLEVFDATRQYQARALASVAASRADAVGGGATAGVAAVLGPFTLAFDTAGLVTEPGVELFSLAVGDWLLDAWVQVDTEFDVADTLSIVGRGTPADSYFMWNGWDLSASQETTGEVLEYAQHPVAGLTQKLTGARSDDDRSRDFPVRAAAACTMNAVIFPSGPNPTFGSVRLWALVARA